MTDATPETLARFAIGDRVYVPEFGEHAEIVDIETVCLWLRFDDHDTDSWPFDAVIPVR
jgi:hypothetical protein